MSGDLYRKPTTNLSVFIFTLSGLDGPPLRVLTHKLGSQSGSYGNSETKHWWGPESQLCHWLCNSRKAPSHCVPEAVPEAVPDISLEGQREMLGMAQPVATSSFLPQHRES